MKILAIWMLVIVLAAGPLALDLDAATRGRQSARDIHWWIVTYVPVPVQIWQILYGPNLHICSPDNPYAPDWCVF